MIITRIVSVQNARVSSNAAPPREKSVPPLDAREATHRSSPHTKDTLTQMMIRRRKERWKHCTKKVSSAQRRFWTTTRAREKESKKDDDDNNNNNTSVVAIYYKAHPRCVSKSAFKSSGDAFAMMRNYKVVCCVSFLPPLSEDTFFRKIFLPFSLKVKFFVFLFRVL